jgi:hypothetical protein
MHSKNLVGEMQNIQSFSFSWRMASTTKICNELKRCHGKKHHFFMNDFFINIHFLKPAVNTMPTETV